MEASDEAAHSQHEVIFHILLIYHQNSWLLFLKCSFYLKQEEDAAELIIEPIRPAAAKSPRASASDHAVGKKVTLYDIF